MRFDAKDCLTAGFATLMVVGLLTGFGLLAYSLYVEPAISWQAKVLLASAASILIGAIGMNVADTL